MSYLHLLERLCEPMVCSDVKLATIAQAVLPSLVAGQNLVIDGRPTTVHVVENRKDSKGLIGIVPIYGSLVSRGGLGSSGITGYSSLERLIDEYVSEGVSGILFLSDSPGGEIPKCFELSRKISQLPSLGIRTAAYIEGMATSGSYALVSGVQRIFAASTAQIGSIGVFSILMNESKRLESAGVSWKIYRAGEKKALGNSLEEPTEEVDAKFQSRVEYLYDQFISLVVETRGLAEDKIRSLQSESFVAAEALSLGLCDELCTSADAALEFLTSKGESFMSGNTTQQQQVNDSWMAESVSIETISAVQTSAALKERERILGIFASAKEFGCESDLFVDAVNDEMSIQMSAKMFAAVAKGRQSTQTIMPSDQGSVSQSSVGAEQTSNPLSATADLMFGKDN